MSDSYPSRVREAVELIGGQSETARQIRVRYGRQVSQQSIAHLVTAKPGRKPAKGSALTPMIAALAGMTAEWLATGRGQKWVGGRRPDTVDNPPPPSGLDLLLDGDSRARNVQPEPPREAHTYAQEVPVVEITRGTAELIRAWEALPENERMRFKREIVAKAAIYRDYVPDGRLGHLAAPTAEGVAAGPAAPKMRKPPADDGTH